MLRHHCTWIAWAATLLTTCGMARGQTYVSEDFERGKPAGWATRDFNRTALTVKPRDDADAAQGHCLCAAGELKWISITCKLPKPIPIRPSVYVATDVRSAGHFGSVSLGVGSKGKLTHLKTGPAKYQPSTRWQRMVWRCDGYFPGQTDVMLDQIAFHQRVAGGFEQPGGGALHEIQIDNVVVAAGDAAADEKALAQRLGGIRHYDGPQAFVLAQAKGLTVWHSPSTAKVFLSQPPPSRTGGAVTVEAARGESESFQLVFAATEPAENLSLRVSALGCAKGSIPASEVRWHPVCYLPVTSRTYGPPVDQQWPEPLSWNRSFRAEPGRNQPVWVTLHVPRDARPGDYHGTLDVVQRGETLASMRVKLTVWDFELPVRPTFRTNQQLWISAPDALDPRPRRAVQSEMLELLAQYRMFDAHLFHRMSRQDQDRAVNEWGWNTIKLPFCGGHQGGKKRKVTKLEGHDIMTPEYERAFEAWLKRWTTQYRERGILDRAFLYLWDEPWGDFEVYDMILWLGRLSKRVAPDLKTLVAAPYSRKFDGAVDIFLAGYTSPELISSARQRGVEFWWWGNSSMPIDLAAIDARMRYGLESVQKGFSGAYCWGLAVWKRGDPWTTPTRSNRAEIALYPGNRAESASPRVVPGISLELNRDGIEDYDYVAMLRKLPSDQAKALAARCERFYQDPRGARTDFAAVDALAKLRREIALALQAARRDARE